MMAGMRRLAAGLVCVALLGVAAAASAGAASRRRSDATAARSFAVGVRTEPFVDSTRPTPANGSFPGSPSRSLPTLVLYPARGAPGGPDRAGAPRRAGRSPSWSSRRHQFQRRGLRAAAAAVGRGRLRDRGPVVPAVEP